MSQPGYIYVLINPSAEGIVKIGRTQLDPVERAKQLSSATGVPTPFTVVYQAYFSDCEKAEIFVHTKLERYRVSNNREFFQVTTSTAIDAVIEAKKYYGLVEKEFDFSEGNEENDDTNGLLNLLTHNEEHPGKDLYNTADAYYYGWGDTIQDYGEAFNLYSKAARLGYANAFLKLGDIYQYGQGRGEDSARALEFYKEAIKHGNDEGWGEMAKVFFYNGQFENEDKCWKKYFSSNQFQKFDLIRRDLTILLYVRSSLERHKPLEYKEQISSEKDGIVARIEEKASHGTNIDFYRPMILALDELKPRSPKEKHPGRQLFDLACDYLWGDDDKTEDHEKAYALFSKAAQLGYSDALLELGNMWRDGIGREVDEERALEFYNEAIRQGNDEGWGEMANIYTSNGNFEHEDECWEKYFTRSHLKNSV